MRSLLIAALLLSVGCADDFVCDESNETCRKARSSAEATCQRLYECGSICIGETDPVPTMCAEKNECIREHMIALCDEADCSDDFYEDSAPLAECIAMVERSTCGTDIQTCAL